MTLLTIVARNLSVKGFDAYYLNTHADEQAQGLTASLFSYMRRNVTKFK